MDEAKKRISSDMSPVFATCARCKTCKKRAKGVLGYRQCYCKAYPPKGKIGDGKPKSVMYDNKLCDKYEGE